MFPLEKSPLSCEAVGGEEGGVVAWLGREGEIHGELQVCQGAGDVAHCRLNISRFTLQTDQAWVYILPRNPYNA